MGKTYRILCCFLALCLLYSPVAYSASSITFKPVVQPDVRGIGYNIERQLHVRYKVGMDNTTAVMGEGTYRMRGGVLKQGSIVTDCKYVVKTTFTGVTSDNVTISLNVHGQTNALKTAIAVADGTNPWGAGTHNCTVVDSTASTWIPSTGSGITSDSDIEIVSAVGGIDAGEVELWISYIGMY